MVNEQRGRYLVYIRQYNRDWYCANTHIYIFQRPLEMCSGSRYEHLWWSRAQVSIRYQSKIKINYISSSLEKESCILSDYLYNFYSLWYITCLQKTTLKINFKKHIVFNFTKWSFKRQSLIIVSVFLITYGWTGLHK